VGSGLWADWQGGRAFFKATMTRRKGALSLGSGCDKRQAGNGLRGQSGKQGSVCDRGAEGAAAGNCFSHSL
jgi:hypothetical protein